MKKLLIVLMLVVVMSGCAGIPTGVKAAISTAEIALNATAADVEAGTDPFGAVEGETEAEKIVRLEASVAILSATVEQAGKNLITATDYIRGKKPAEEVTNE